MQSHHVKSIPKHYEQLGCDKRTAEVRCNDRGYQIGDGITFHEYLNGLYTGNTKTAMIAYIDDYGCQFGYVNLSLNGFGCLIVE